MSKMSELYLVVDDLRAASQSLTNAIDGLTALFKESIAESSEPEMPKPALVTLEQVRGILADKSREGHTEAIRELLIKHGGSKLSEISPDRYPELLKDAEGLT